MMCSGFPTDKSVGCARKIRRIFDSQPTDKSAVLAREIHRIFGFQPTDKSVGCAREIRRIFGFQPTDLSVVLGGKSVGFLVSNPQIYLWYWEGNPSDFWFPT
ncbi:MAG: hypothetical protein ACK4Q5_13810, partial [Saprospiraceae bacterium]